MSDRMFKAFKLIPCIQTSFLSGTFINFPNERPNNLLQSAFIHLFYYFSVTHTHIRYDSWTGLA